MDTSKPYVDHLTHTITVSGSFLRAASDPATKEFAQLLDLTSKLPNYTVIPMKVKKATKKSKASKPTYNRMEKYIRQLRNADANLVIFEKVKAFAKSQPNPYQTVLTWFSDSFPDYGCYPEFDNEGYPIVEANCICFEAYKQSNEAAGKQVQNEMEPVGAWIG